ncbi:hypothetical protein ACN47E_003393 [Coniothyrium glycines]
MPPRPPSFDALPPYAAASFDFPPASSSAGDALQGPGNEQLEQSPYSEASFAARRERLRGSQTARRGTLHRIFGPPRDNEFTDDLSRRPPTAHPNRPRATPSERYLRRSQARLREARAADLASATEMFDSLHDAAMPNPFHLPNSAVPYTRPRSPIVEINSERRTKRRKLEHDVCSTPEYTCFKYGHRGQVVPGRLRMEIVSCDGGEHRRDSPPGLYRVQNVLRNDKSVYCSESSQCNLLLKHIGEAAFALEKIVIRAPDRGFTAPVQEGLVFVAMSADDLLSSTSAYNLQYQAPMSPTASSPDEDEEQLSLREAIDDPLIWQQSRRATQEDMEERIENLRLRSERLNAASASLISSLRSDRERRNILRQMVEHEDEVDGDHCEHGTEDPYSGPAGISAPTPPPFTVTTASEENESETSEEAPSAAIMADRLRRESRWRPTSDEEDDGAVPRPGTLRRPAAALNYTAYAERRERRDQRIGPLQASRIAVPSRIEPVDPILDTESLIAPHARFFIAKNRNKITIQFTPAISGKHVLLKFWSPKHDGNIDIESVQFHGFSGPRYFPAMQPR